MELHRSSSTAAAVLAMKKLRSYLKVALFMARKGVISKRSRRLVMDMNLMLKRGKLAGKSLRSALITLHQQHHRRNSKHHRYEYWTSPPMYRDHRHHHEYEFSCSSSPNDPDFFHVISSKQRRGRSCYFPCLNSVTEECQTPFAVVLPKTIGCGSTRGSQELEVAPAGRESVYNNSPSLPSPLTTFKNDVGSGHDPASSSEEENTAGDNCRCRSRQIDEEAEEFIRRFYEQLKMQRMNAALLEYQEYYRNS